MKPITVPKPWLKVDMSSVGQPAPKGRTLNPLEQTAGAGAGSCRRSDEAVCGMGSI